MPNAAELWRAFQKDDAFIPHARRSFVGRLDARQAYYSLVGQALEQEFRGYYIINYHGIGGIGKSTLLHQLRQELLGADAPPSTDTAGEACIALRKRFQPKKALSLQADFDDASLSTPQDVLTRFRAQVMDQYSGAMFPLFDLALLRLSQKYGKRVPPDEQKAALSDNPVVSFALDVVGDLTGAGLLISAGQTAMSVAQSVQQKLSGRRGCIRRANTEIAQMSAPELVRHLPYYFAMDLNAMEPSLVCVYLDTYEKMVSHGEGAGRSTGFDEDWLWGDKGLVKNLGNAVFAVAGRESLEGERLAQEPFLQREPTGPVSRITEFSREDSITFLTHCGIGDHELRQELYTLTNGNPFYLELCADEYERLIAKGVKDLSAESFSGADQRLAERYLRYVRPELLDGLRMLCAMGQWTDELYDRLCQRLPQLPREGESAYNELIHLTYVQRLEQGWRIQRSVAEVLAHELSDALLLRLLDALADAADQETRQLRKLGAAHRAGQSEPWGGLDIIQAMERARATVRTAQAMEARAEAYTQLCELDKARLWQERAIACWRTLGKKANLLSAVVRLADILDSMAFIQEKAEALQMGLDLADELGQSAPIEDTILLWEHLARSSRTWEEDADIRVRVWKLRKRQSGDAPLRELWIAQCRLGQSLSQCDEPENMQPETAQLAEKAGRLLEEAFEALKGRDQREAQPFSPYTLYAGEVLCQFADSTLSPVLLEKTRSWMRGLSYGLSGSESLGSLRAWQAWLDLVLGSEQRANHNCGLDMRGIFDLQRQVMLGLQRHLGKQHPETLDANWKTVKAYLMGSETVSSGLDAMIAELLQEELPAIGRAKKTELTFFDDPEYITNCCQDLANLYTLYLGREHPKTFQVMDLLSRTYSMAGQHEKATLCRLDAQDIYERLSPRQQTELTCDIRRLTSGLVDDYESLEDWEKAASVQEQLLSHISELGGNEDTEQKRLLTLYLEWLWQESGLTIQRSQQLLALVLTGCGNLKGVRDRHPYIDSAWLWCRENGELVEANMRTAVEAAWKETGCL